MSNDPTLIVRQGQASGVLVPVPRLCEVAAQALASSYQFEHGLTQQSPYPWPKIRKMQDYQKLCLTILRLAKKCPRDYVEVPLQIWRDLEDGKPCLVV